MLTSYPPIADHSVYFFFPFEFELKQAPQNIESLKQAKISSLLEAPWLPRVYKGKTSADPHVDKGIWREGDPTALFSPDLHPHLRQILSGPPVENGQEKDKASDAKKPFAGHPPFCLSPEMLHLLTGAVGKTGKGMTLPLSKSAKSRLELNDDFQFGVRCVGGTLYLFGTGVGALVLEMKYLVSPGELKMPFFIIEATSALAHAVKKETERLQWLEAPGAANAESGKPAQRGFLLEEVVRSLIAPVLAPNDPGLAWRRIFTYTAISFESKISTPELRDELVARLSKRYTSHYQLPTTITGGDHVTPFENITHGVAIEGGCVVVEQTQPKIDFLQNYLRTPVKNVYLPIALISFHEFHWLMKLTQESGIIIDRHRPGTHLKELRRLRDHVIQFRLFYRFSHASLISQHNLVHQIWRGTYSLDKVLTELSWDLMEVEKILNGNKLKEEQRMEERKERDWKLFASLGTFAGAFILIREFVEIFIDLENNSLTWQLGLYFPDKMDPNFLNNLKTTAETVHHYEKYGAIGGAVLAGIIALLVYFKKPKNSGHDQHH